MLSVSMKPLLRICVCILVVIIIVALPRPAQYVRAQDGSSQDDLTQLADMLYVEVNRGLLIEGIHPLARNDVLDQIAQTIADELGAKGSYTSLPRQLADQFGYPRWPDNGQRVLRDAINAIGIQSPAEFVTNRRAEIADIVRNTFYREVGVGVTKRIAVEGGTEQTVYVVVMGAQPNVLPVIINDGSHDVFTDQVELYIHNELSLAYQTDESTIQQAHSFRLANSEADLEAAEWIPWQNNNFAYGWQLAPNFGEKSVWVELEDSKGVRVRYEAPVTYSNRANAPSTFTPTTPLSPVTLHMIYRGDTFTLQVVSDRRVVRLQDIYFTWFNGERFYELENADALQSVNLSEFPANACIQVRLIEQANNIVEVGNCEVIYLEAGEFADQESVFWNASFGTFDVYDGERLLGSCDTAADTCDITLR